MKTKILKTPFGYMVTISDKVKPLFKTKKEAINYIKNKTKCN